MIRKFRSCINLGIACCVMLYLNVSSLHAGWLGFRNDTKIPVVVQEEIAVNNLIRQGKPQTLHVGDSVRDSQICPGKQRKFTIYDAKGIPLFTGNFPCPNAEENVLYLIKTDPRGKIIIEPQKSKK